MFATPANAYSKSYYVAIGDPALMYVACLLGPCIAESERASKAVIVDLSGPNALMYVGPVNRLYARHLPMQIPEGCRVVRMLFGAGREDARAVRPPVQTQNIASLFGSVPTAEAPLLYYNTRCRFLGFAGRIIRITDVIPA